MVFLGKTMVFVGKTLIFLGKTVVFLGDSIKLCKSFQGFLKICSLVLILFPERLSWCFRFVSLKVL